MTHCVDSTQRFEDQFGERREKTRSRQSTLLKLSEKKIRIGEEEAK
jgi:hypothetical protein